MPHIGEQVHYWGSDYYRDGFLLKEVIVSSYITAENVKATVDELQHFRENKSSKLSDEYEDFDGTYIHTYI